MTLVSPQPLSLKIGPNAQEIKMECEDGFAGATSISEAQFFQREQRPLSSTPQWSSVHPVAATKTDTEDRGSVFGLSTPEASKHDVDFHPTLEGTKRTGTIKSVGSCAAPNPSSEERSAFVQDFLAYDLRKEYQSLFFTNLAEEDDPGGQQGNPAGVKEEKQEQLRLHSPRRQQENRSSAASKNKPEELQSAPFSNALPRTTMGANHRARRGACRFGVIGSGMLTGKGKVAREERGSVPSFRPGTGFSRNNEP
ncbi:unnamed protein product [Amoebophrya sp. A120]|nr:unnamed protein product [Amoebophrya sp. A120]|eukprot:GSA120T00006056001.1